MLLFIIPLQSKAVSSDWDRVAEITRRTIDSVCAQKDGRFQALLVCNESPVKEHYHPKLSIISEDFPVPQVAHERMRDKWAKVRRGLLEVDKLNATHVMVVDADDLVSNRLASLVQSERGSGHPGWLLQRGYYFDQGTGNLFSCNDFNHRCGTSSVLDVRGIDLPKDMEGPSSCPILKHGHSTIGNYYTQRGNPLEHCPYRGAVYVVGTAENDSRAAKRWFRSKREFFHCLWSWRRLTPRRRKEYSIRSLTLSEPPRSALSQRRRPKAA